MTQNSTFKHKKLILKKAPKELKPSLLTVHLCQAPRNSANCWETVSRFYNTSMVWVAGPDAPKDTTWWKDIFMSHRWWREVLKVSVVNFINMIWAVNKHYTTRHSNKAFWLHVYMFSPSTNIHLPFYSLHLDFDFFHKSTVHPFM